MNDFFKWLMLINAAMSLVPTLVQTFEVPGRGEEKKAAVIDSTLKGIDIALVASGNQPLDPQGKDVIKQVSSNTVDSVVGIYNIAGKFQK